MNFKSKQALFDFISSHLLKQGKKSEDEGHACFYRGPKGLECALGCIIPNKLYNIAMEAKSVHKLIEYSSVTLNGYKLPWYVRRYRFFLEELQFVHDEETVSNWKTCLLNLGRKHNLDLSRVQRMKLRED